MRAELTGPWQRFADLDFETDLADTLTLSTFHGCPPDEIEGITKHLIDEHDLDVIVKLNPTLLGYEAVRTIVNDELGYHDVQVKEEAFAADLQFDRGIELIAELNQYAADRGRRFGIKLTNTLVVNNAKAWMPEDTMYLSGPPLHVIAMTLLDRLTPHLPDEVMVSFSAGITKDNLADSLAVGVNPATICSDLLKPGGYGRLAPMLKALTKEITESGCSSLVEWKAQHALTAGAYSERIRTNGEYHFTVNEKLPREVDHTLEMFGCVACNFCITVCPNDAFFNIASPQDEIEGRQQYLLLPELCNECGNCMTFCPEDGDPAQVKPKLYTDPAVFAARSDQGFLISDGQVIDARADAETVAVVQDLLNSGSPLS
jgi:putative selenate reductase